MVAGSAARVAVEVDCDARVLQEADAGVYGDLLLEVGRRRATLPIVGVMAFAERARHLERRIWALTRSRRTPSRRSLAVAVAMGVVAVGVACAAPVPDRPTQGTAVIAQRTFGSSQEQQRLVRIDPKDTASYLIFGPEAVAAVARCRVCRPADRKSLLVLGAVNSRLDWIRQARPITKRSGTCCRIRSQAARHTRTWRVGRLLLTVGHGGKAHGGVG